jgi:Ner family transcriptional regulator
MTNLASLKKPAPGDWHPADVVAELRKIGWSLQQLAFENGYTHRSSLSMALRVPYPRAEAIIAKALGVKPQEIWPSRYNKDGTTNRLRGARPMRPAGLPAKPTTARAIRNLQPSRAS